MNLFIDYQRKIENFLKDLKKNGIIKLPDQTLNITIELPPKGVDADISCNVAMLLAKCNKKSPNEISKGLKLLIQFSINFLFCFLLSTLILTSTLRNGIQ